MRRIVLTLACALLAGAMAAPAAQGAFGLSEFDVTYTDSDGFPERRAGAHPFAVSTELAVNTAHDDVLEQLLPDEGLRDFAFAQIEGLAGNPTAVERCSTLEFLFREDGLAGGECDDSTVVGTTEVQIISLEDTPVPAPVYNLPPPPGKAAKLGFWAINTPVVVELGVSEDYPHNIVATSANIPQTVPFFASDFTIWGVPADPRHDPQRGDCLNSSESCAAGIEPEPFITLPRSCEGPLATTYEVTSWASPPSHDSGAALTRDAAGAPAGLTGCEALGFSPRIATRPTTARAESPTGLDVELSVDDPQLTSPSDGARAATEIKRAVVTLPEGMTANPSLAEGLSACTEADLARERSDSAPGEGCPQESKVGAVEVKTPLLEGETLKGALYIAQPHENPFDSLLALYMTIKSPKLGIGITLAGEISPHPKTGQLITTFGGPGTDPLPQLPFSEFRLRFREGARSPLISPPTCGTYEVKAVFTPWADPSEELTRTPRFAVTEGVDGGACPSSQPFEPGFDAGTASNAAGSHSPFAMRLTRSDGDAALRRFDATLPGGLTARLAGVTRCPEAQIALARSKDGRAEQRSPSCPLNSRIGGIRAGAGVGSQLIYVPGDLYLAGPHNGAPLSVVGVVPAVAGPFDVGTVVVRQALQVDPVSAQVTVAGSESDAIPTILAGIPLRVRDIQIRVDRSAFTLNPTSCAPKTIEAAISATTQLARRSVPFQAASCASLGFEPRLGLRLFGGTRRGAFPALRVVYRPGPGEQANLRRLSLVMPSSAFIEQGHFRTICTRVQYAADACPRAAIYGFARAWTPLLDEPLQGPVYLRSNGGARQLPDAVLDLRGLVDVEVGLGIDSVRGRLRTTTLNAPDVPVSAVVVQMQGGQKGLFVNSRNLCASRNRATAGLAAHNDARTRLRPAVRPVACLRKARRKARQARGAARGASASVSAARPAGR